MIKIAPLLLLISSLPQTYKLYKTKDSYSISLVTYLITWVAIGLLITGSHGFVLISNIVSFTMMTINIILIIKYRL